MAESSPPPPSFSAVSDRPVSGCQYQPPLKAIDDHHTNLKRLPTFNDVAPGLGKSYKDAAAVGGGYADRVPAAVIQEGAKVLSVGDFAGAHKHTSGVVGDQFPYEEGKIPSQSGVRPINHSSGYQGGYQYSSGPPSYNGEHFGRH